jgi:hypothetical protein
MFYPGLYCRVANITDNLWTNQGNSSISEPNNCGLYSRAGYNGACTVYYKNFTLSISTSFMDSP